MNDYTSLGLGAIWLIIVFVGTLLHMASKRRKAESLEKHPLHGAAEGTIESTGLLGHR